MQKSVFLLVSIFILMSSNLHAGQITLNEVQTFLNDTDQVLHEESGEYVDGIDLYKLWGLTGITPQQLHEDSDEYLFNFKVGKDDACILYTPKTELFSNDNMKILRLTENVQCDYQFFFFVKDPNSEEWLYCDHLDVYYEKYNKPKITFLNDSLFYLTQESASGTGVYYCETAFYLFRNNHIEHLLDIPTEGWVHGWGMAFSRDFKSTGTYTPEQLTVEYTIDISANTFYTLKRKDLPEEFPLFTAKRTVVFKRDDGNFILDEANSHLNRKDLTDLFMGGAKEYYSMFQKEFDGLEQKNAMLQNWHTVFINEILEEGI
ncbi:MAG: hypothetical protein KKH94_10655 [Candidatus Omnitrophica bacterium]|nr:hypothetical protein [Candidatus Omnitrophota bacterium]